MRIFWYRAVSMASCASGMYASALASDMPCWAPIASHPWPFAPRTSAHCYCMRRACVCAIYRLRNYGLTRPHWCSMVAAACGRELFFWDVSGDEREETKTPKKGAVPSPCGKGRVLHLILDTYALISVCTLHTLSHCECERHNKPET